MWLKFKTEDENLTKIAKLQQLLGISGMLNFSGSAKTARIVRHHSQRWLGKGLQFGFGRSGSVQAYIQGLWSLTAACGNPQGNLLDTGAHFPQSAGGSG